MRCMFHIFIGSVLFLNNYIQALSIDRKYQRKDYGTKLSKYAINKILSKGYKEVTLKVLDGNIPAINLYKKLGFEVVKWNGHKIKDRQICAR